jgi:hypothetical protein
MSRFIFFTKTRWNEPPRLRHQLAELLAQAGHQVLFFEKPWLPGSNRPPASAAPPGIRLLEQHELIHHKARIGPLARWANAAWASMSIVRGLRAHEPTSADIIVNFNYDYYFLRRLFPGNPIVTVINDDFITNAPWLIQPTLQKSQRMACRMSDAVLTPSVALQEQIAEYFPAELFMPWADVAYASPPKGYFRKALFYWGYIGRRLDYVLLEKLADELAAAAPETMIEFFGPTEGDAADHPLFTRHPNVRLRGSAQLSEIELDRMAGSIIPYARGVPEVDVIVMPNKAMQLLARGIPLLIAGMPRFELAPFVRRLDEGDPIATFRSVQAGFDGLQGPIRDYVANNSAGARLEQFQEVVNRATAKRRRG